METTAHSAAYEALRAENEVLRTRLQRAEQEAAAARERLAQLEAELVQLKRLLFGVKSERFVPSSEFDLE